LSAPETVPRLHGHGSDVRFHPVRAHVLPELRQPNVGYEEPVREARMPPVQGGDWDAPHEDLPPLNEFDAVNFPPPNLY
jgi:hypothetical protein